MEVRPTGGALGAEILGIDLRSATEGEVEHIYQALLEHEVVFLRNTQLDDAGHLKFAGRFGTPSVFPIFKVLGETEPTFQVIHDGPDSAPAAVIHPLIRTHPENGRKTIFFGGGFMCFASRHSSYRSKWHLKGGHMCRCRRWEWHRLQAELLPMRCHPCTCRAR